MNKTLRVLATLIICQLSLVSHAQQAWTARWLTNPSTTSDKGKVICVDKRGNSYVAGTTDFDGDTEPSAGQRVEVIKYDPTGMEIWARLITPSPIDGTITDIGNIVTDDLYVYVVTTQVLNGNNDIYVRKLDVSNGLGSIQWLSLGDGVGVRRFGSVGNFSDVAADISLDSAGNVFVCGTSTIIPTPAETDVCIVSYSSSGALRWSALYDFDGEEPHGQWENSSEHAVAMHSMPNGSSVVAGTVTMPSGATRSFAVGFMGGGTSIGNVITDTMYAPDAITDVTMNDTGDRVYVCGYTKVGVNTWMDVCSYQFDLLLDSFMWKIPQVVPWSRANAIAYWNGFVYATGQRNWSGETSLDHRSVTVKLIAGTGLPSATWPVIANEQDWQGVRYRNLLNWGEHSDAITVAGNGNVYLTGAGNDSNIVLFTPFYHSMRWDKDGVLRQEWIFDNGTAGDGAYDRATAIAMVGAGRIHVTGESTSATSLDFATLLYDLHQNVLPGTLQVIEGVPQSGSTIEDLFVGGADDNRFEVAGFPPTNETTDGYYVEIKVTGTVPNNASELSLHLEARTSFPAETFTQDIKLWNFLSGQWDTVDTRLSSPLTDTIVEARDMGDPAPYISQGGGSYPVGHVMARLGYRPFLTETEGWQAQIDQLVWQWVN